MKIKPDDAISFIPYTQTGITYREYYTGLAMQGILSTIQGLDTPVDVARKAVIYADNLIKELNKTEE